MFTLTRINVKGFLQAFFTISEKFVTNPHLTEMMCRKRRGFGFIKTSKGHLFSR